MVPDESVWYVIETLSPTAKSESVAGFLSLVNVAVDEMLKVRVPSVLFSMEMVLALVSTAVIVPLALVEPELDPDPVPELEFESDAA